MRSLRKAHHRLTSLMARRKVEQDLAREIEIHVEQLARQQMAEGVSERDAWLRARREFGSVELLSEGYRPAMVWP